MARYLLRRLLLLLPVAWGVSTLVFLLIHLTPGDPVEVMLGETALPAAKEALRHSLRLDQPLPEQYLQFLQGLVTGDLGTSLFSREPVLTRIVKALPATIELAVAGLAIALIIALPLGILAAVRQDTGLDHGSRFVALLGVSIPNFVLGPLLILAFAIQLDWLPVSGRGGFSHLVLPALTLGMALAGILSRMVRASLLEVLGQDYIRAARAKGLSERQVILRHSLMAALIPVITILGLQFGALLAGTIITETIFAWPGLGRLTLEAIHARDYPLVQGCVLVISFGYVIVNAMTDMVYAYVDPRIRYG
ncbi:MAG: ABC transporter permease [candidate division NC10 bacterium]|nr:ABC transporter permease [candidate division NC10 bacterium]